MKQTIVIAGSAVLSLAILGAGVFFVLHKSQAATPQQSQIAALQKLRDSGVITAQEYDAKVQSLPAAAPPASGNSQEKIAALQELRESGVITPQEFDAKVQALQTTAAPSAPTQPVHFAKIASGARKVEITDPQYQITAATMEIPADWKFAGTIARPDGCHAHGASIKFTAQSPDGLTAVVALPGVAWNWQNSEAAKKFPPACPPIDIDSATSFLVNIALPNIHPDAKNAKVLSVLPMEAEAQASLKDQLDKQLKWRASSGMFKQQINPKLTLEGARLRLQYERDGHPVEEMISAVVQCEEQTMAAMFNNPAYQRRTCFSRGTGITRAPLGHLDEVLAKTRFDKTLQPNPEWQNRMMADQQAAAKQAMDANNAQAAANLQHFKEQGEARLAAGRAFQQRQTDSFNNAIAIDRQKQAAIDASAQATVRYSLDRQVFTNPNTGQTIEASNQYSHQWISSDGSTLIQTNDHTYDPNGQVYPVSQSWSELVVK